MEVIDYAQQVIGSVPPEIWGLIFGGLGLSALQQKIKHFLELQSPYVIQAITVVFSLAGAIIPVALGWLGSNDLGYKGAAMFTAMTIGYRYVISPVNKYMTNFRNDVETEKASMLANKGVLAVPVSEAVTTVPVPMETVSEALHGGDVQSANEFDG